MRLQRRLLEEDASMHDDLLQKNQLHRVSQRRKLSQFQRGMPLIAFDELCEFLLSKVKGNCPKKFLRDDCNPRNNFVTVRTNLRESPAPRKDVSHTRQVGMNKTGIIVEPPRVIRRGFPLREGFEHIE